MFSNNLVGMGQSSDSIPIKAAGDTQPITEKTPKGIKRLIVFGSVLLTGGVARNYQVFMRKERKNKVVPISPNDSSSKGLEGMQVLEEGDSIEITVAAAVDLTELDYSVSYLDYRFDSYGRI